MKKFTKKIKIKSESTAISQDIQDNVHRRNIIDDTLQKRHLQQQVAIDVHYELFSLYKRESDFFMRCPCWTQEDPIASCKLCYGQGKLPPYQIHGYHHLVLFHVDSMCTVLNMKANFRDPSGVPSWQCTKNSYNSRIVSDWYPIQPNAGKIVNVWTDVDEDELHFFNLEYTSDGTTWKPLDSLESDLPNVSRLKFRVTVEKDETDDDVPSFRGVHIRYATESYVEIKATSPQWQQSIDRSTLGLLKLIEQGTLSVQCNVPNIETGDMFHHLETGTRFRVVGIESMEANDITFDWQLRVRRVQDDELLHDIP